MRGQCSRPLSALTVSAPLRSHLALFSREEASAPLPGGSGPARAKAERRLKSWGSQVELAEEFEKGINLSQAEAADEDELLDDDDILSLTSSDPEASALLAASPREQEMAEEEEAGEPAAPSRPPCLAYAELLEVMERASGRLQLPWERVRKETVTVTQA
ncbi:hypothetical protein DPX16_12859 [Anabarilius grahami]|uniref:Uncharacterized protein n=1 Tax=Anabarilius grahami TaxID=495550 RepID=A0A3N0XD35_ANAGA|nr:hypothetical protein DPX16_12859 [Anabarilius grahami]